MIQVVVNADDLGLHPKIDEGIFRAHEGGIVSSATILVTGPTAVVAVERAAKTKLGLGVHLCLTTHLTPASKTREVRWLAPGGRFRHNWAELSTAWLAGLIPSEEVEREFRAQIQRARSLGAQVDHLDTHQNLHLLPGMTRIVERLAVENSVPVRWPVDKPSRQWLVHPRSAVKTMLIGGLARLKPEGGAKRVRAHGVFDSGRLTEARLLRILERLSPGSHEIVCHPGFSPGIVREDPEWRYAWETELDAVTSPRVRSMIEERGIHIVRYRDLTS